MSKPQRNLNPINVRNMATGKISAPVQRKVEGNIELKLNAEIVTWTWEAIHICLRGTHIPSCNPWKTKFSG